MWLKTERIFQLFAIRHQIIRKLFIEPVQTSVKMGKKEVKWNYPKTEKVSIFDEYNKMKILDEYRYLENENDERTKKFVENQNKLTRPFLDECETRTKFHEELSRIFNFPKFSAPFRRGEFFYVYENSGLENQNVLYWATNESDIYNKEKRKIFINPNEWSEDGTIALSGTSFHKSGRLLAYGKSVSGSDWLTIHFRRINDFDDFEDLENKLEKVKFSSMQWMPNGKSFFYHSYPQQEGVCDGTETTSNDYHSLYHHILEDDQPNDKLIMKFDDPTLLSDIQISTDHDYMILGIQKGCEATNRLWISEFNYNLDKLRWIKLFDKNDGKYEYVGNDGKRFLIQTTANDAKRGKVLEVLLNEKNELKDVKDFIPEHKEDVLEFAKLFGINNYFLVSYQHSVRHQLKIFDSITGEYLNEIIFPTAGQIIQLSGDKYDSVAYLKFTSFLSPGDVFKLKLLKMENLLKPQILRKTILNDFSTNDCKVEQVKYKSNDGTEIPMYILSLKGMKKDGNNPVFLYGYGGFGISLLPSFRVSQLIWVKRFKGIFAVPALRGGGEFGEKWHDEGKLEKKQNVFDDFSSAAKYLIKESYTKNSRICINGGSNGGLLVGASINQNPQLFGVAVAHVGVMDMLRFHKFTIGHAWIPEYGCSTQSEQFDILFKYSPLHNIKDCKNGNSQYPATLLLTGDHDDRVVPLHSLKFAAKLQDVIGSNDRQKSPLMILVDTKSGHGGGKPVSKQIDETSDMYAFIAKNMELEWISDNK
ncbi:hypothetical protein SNEBB_005802 [Seison nebaliae]|nr:hypothetical protein SNEBB_005802 [Seison nebaliae]